MKKQDKIEYLMEHHLGEWLKTRQEIEDKISRGNAMFCFCGRLATGLHERNCGRFRDRVDGETIKALSHLLKIKPEGV